METPIDNLIHAGDLYGNLSTNNYKIHYLTDSQTLKNCNSFDRENIVLE